MTKEMECTQVREHLPAFDQETFSTELLGHLESCEGCRTELAEYRELQVGLSALAETQIAPPVWLLGSVTERTMDAARRRAPLALTTDQVRRTTRGIGEHPVAAAGSALGLVLVAGAVMLGRARRHRPIGAKALA